MGLVPNKLHDWPVSVDEAVDIQKRFKQELILHGNLNEARLVTAVDTAYNDNNNRLYAVAVTMRFPEMSEVECTVADLEVLFPYIPALLSFREGPVVMEALSHLNIRPDAMIFAAHGIAHPRGFGLASHIGLLFNIPSIGCARRLLVGEFQPPDTERGSCASLYCANIMSGYVYRTKTDVKPMFISPGHKCSQKAALDLVKKCLTIYRMPEPLRQAHLYASKYKKPSNIKKTVRNKY
jgi:deoxyribonuclease V